MSIKEKAIAVNKAVQQTDFSAIKNLVKENYIQHTPVVADGREGLLQLLSKIEYKEIPVPKINTIRSFTDGDYVVLHHEVFWPNRKVMFEIFRFQDEQAAEHWSGIMDHPNETSNGHSMVDGAAAVVNGENTQANKSQAKSFVETVLIRGELDKVLDYYHPDVIQHNPYIDNTVPGLIKGIDELRKQGITIKIEEIQFVLGEGNFVVVFSKGQFGGKPTAFFDLFRIENKKIVEHWDVLQEVPEMMAHGNGMFKLSLYKRLGSYDGIAAFVDLAFPRVAAHPDLEKYFIGHANESKYRQRQLIVDRLCSITGGPVVYLGRSLDSVHRGLGITDSQWKTFMGILTQAMDERKITGHEKEEFIQLFEDQFRKLTVESEMN